MAMYNVLMVIGWVFLVASWIVPAIMKKDNSDKHFVGAVLAAVACGIFVSNLVVQLMK